jgi:4-amino-4-deoxy-L-arabinose transferase-like glycosyltransferase
LSSLKQVNESSARRFSWWRPAVLALLLLTFFLRVHRLGDQRVWWDEGWSVWVSRFSMAGILAQTGNDVHPPLYFWLLHLWRSLSGDSEFGLRLLSSFLGTLTVAVTFTLGRDIGRRLSTAPPAYGVGLLVALFLAVSRFAVAWSQEIRMYALASLLAVVAVWAARRVWDGGGRWPKAVYVAATTTGLYTLYLFAPVWAAVNVAWLWMWWNAPNRRRAFFEWAALQLLVVALFLPWALYASGGFLSTASATPIQVLDFLQIYWTVLTVGIPLDVKQYSSATLPALAIFGLSMVALLVAAWRHLRNSPLVVPPRGKAPADARWRPARDLTLLLVVLLLPVIIVYFVSLPRQNFYNPPFSPRYLVIFTSFYSILLAWGLVMVGRTPTGQRTGRTSVGPVVAAVLAAFMLLVSFTGLQPYHPGRVLIDDYPSLTGTIDAYRRPNDAVVLYTDTDWPIFAYHHPDPWQGVPSSWTMTPELVADYLGPIWETHDAVWLVTTPYSAAGDPQRLLPGWLAERATAVRNFTYKDMVLTLYTRTAERAASAGRLAPDVRPPAPLDVTLPDGYRLTGYTQAATNFKSGDTVHLFVYGRGDTAATAEFGFLDAAGSNLWQPTAVALAAGPDTVRTQIDLVVPPEAPDGRYRFAVRDASGTIPFGELTIRQKDAAFLTEADVTMANRLDVPFGQGIRLLGYTAGTTVRPGEALPLTLYWSSGGDIRQRYKVFTHVLGDTFNAATGNFIWGQADNEPAANSRPTTTWRADEVIVDAFAIPLAPDAPPGTYRLEVGLYDPISGERLPVFGADGTTADHVLLGTVLVEP